MYFKMPCKPTLLTSGCRTSSFSSSSSVCIISVLFWALWERKHELHICNVSLSTRMHNSLKTYIIKDYVCNLKVTDWITCLKWGMLSDMPSILRSIPITQASLHQKSTPFGNWMSSNDILNSTKILGYDPTISDSMHPLVWPDYTEIPLTDTIHNAQILTCSPPSYVQLKINLVFHG